MRTACMDRLRTWWEFLRTSLWFVPSIMGVAAIGLAAYTVVVERTLPATSPETPWFLYVGHPEDARSLLGTLLSSMITMASLVFSITMVVLTLAASQFGPRLIRSFMAHPQTQFVLGTFVMTTMYCLFMLLAMEVRDTSERLPYASVSIAAALTVASVALLVVFLHTLAMSIVSETVIDRVADELDLWVNELAPLGTPAPPRPETAPVLPEDFDSRVTYIGPGRPGYVQAIQFGRLLATAERADLIIVMYFRAGHYVVPGAQEIAVYPAERLTAELKAKIQDDILVGAHRTPMQDPDFSIRHLDEIAVRALSPAINDPYTAVSVIDRVSGSLSTLMSRALPPALFSDSQGVARVMCTQASYAGLIGEAFNQIRQNGRNHPIVVLHLLEAIERIAQHVQLPEQHSALAEQAGAILQSSRRIKVPVDRRSIDGRYASAQRAREHASRRWTARA